MGRSDLVPTEASKRFKALFRSDARIVCPDIGIDAAMYGGPWEGCIEKT